MHSLRRQLCSSNKRELNQKQLDPHCDWESSRMSHTISMGPHKHCTIGENPNSIWKFCERFDSSLFGRPPHRLRGRVCDWGFSTDSSSGGKIQMWPMSLVKQGQMWTLWNKEQNKVHLLRNFNDETLSIQSFRMWKGLATWTLTSSQG